MGGAPSSRRPTGRERLHAVLRVLIAVVWLVFGLAKTLDLVPRHEEIVARILGGAHAGAITVGIGGLEILLGLWVLSGRKPRLAAIIQIVLVAGMNLLETVLAPDLLLWGRLNGLLALAFIGLIYVNEWKLPDRTRA